MDAVNALGVRWSPSQHDCPMLTAAPSPRARTEVRGWGRGGKQRRADQVLAPEAGGSRNPAARGAGTGLGAGRCLRGGSLPAGSPPALELGPPQGQRGLHAPPPPSSATLSVPELVQAAQPVLWTFGDLGPFCLYSSGVLGFPHTVNQVPVQCIPLTDDRLF